MKRPSEGLTTKPAACLLPSNKFLECCCPRCAAVWAPRATKVSLRLCSAEAMVWNRPADDSAASCLPAFDQDEDSNLAFKDNATRCEVRWGTWCRTLFEDFEETIHGIRQHESSLIPEGKARLCADVSSKFKVGSFRNRSDRLIV